MFQFTSLEGCVRLMMFQVLAEMVAGHQVLKSVKKGVFPMSFVMVGH